MRPALHVENGKELGCLWLLHRAGISGQQIGAAECPRPCTPLPFHHRPASPQLDSARWFGRSMKRSLCATILGAKLRRVNELRAELLSTPLDSQEGPADQSASEG